MKPYEIEMSFKDKNKQERIIFWLPREVKEDTTRFYWLLPKSESNRPTLLKMVLTFDPDTNEITDFKFTGPVFRRFKFETTDQELKEKKLDSLSSLFKPGKTRDSKKPSANEFHKSVLNLLKNPLVLSLVSKIIRPFITEDELKPEEVHGDYPSKLVKKVSDDEAELNLVDFEIPIITENEDKKESGKTGAFIKLNFKTTFNFRTRGNKIKGEFELNEHEVKLDLGEDEERSDFSDLLFTKNLKDEKKALVKLLDINKEERN